MFAKVYQCYRFFVNDWNAFIHIAGGDAEVTWVGEKPKHAVEGTARQDEMYFVCDSLKTQMSALEMKGVNLMMKQRKSRGEPAPLFRFRAVANWVI
jgi:hypothetical protein